MVELRYYQREAIEAAYRWIREHRTPCCIELPTGAGKTPVLCSMAADVWRRAEYRTLVVSHVKELIEQAKSSMDRWFAEIDTTVYSAGLGSRDLSGSVVIAGVQSISRRQSVGRFDLVLIDEAHCIPQRRSSQYQRLLDLVRAENPKAALVGLTATPYRLDGGVIYGQDRQFSGVCYRVGVDTLIRQGYLSKLSSKDAEAKADLSNIKIVGGEFDERQMQDEFIKVATIATQEVLSKSRDRKSVLIFSPGVDHARLVSKIINESGEQCEVITGTTPADERSRIAEEFRANRLKYLANVSVLTTGFDATCVDMVCLLRATLSPGLFYQMVGRGLRLSPGKDYCRVLDFGGNVGRHGPIDAIRPPAGDAAWICVGCQEINSAADEFCRDCGRHQNAWNCKACGEVVPAKGIVPDSPECPKCGINKTWRECPSDDCGGWISPKERHCPDCGVFVGVDPAARHDEQASEDAILSSDIKPKWIDVTSENYLVHTNKKTGKKSMRVVYWDGVNKIADEWICFEHTGFARSKACEWWADRCDEPIPESVAEAIEIAKSGKVWKASAIQIERQPGSPFPKIVKHQLRTAANANS